MSRIVFFIISILVFHSANATEYNRAEWGGFANGTRETILERDKVELVIDFYTGWPIPKEACQLEHIVPVAVAYRAGGSEWTREQRKTFYSDTENLVCTTGGTNASKGDKTPNEFSPKTNRSGYVSKWLYICEKYGLECVAIKTEEIMQ